MDVLSSLVLWERTVPMSILNGSPSSVALSSARAVARLSSLDATILPILLRMKPMSGLFVTHGSFRYHADTSVTTFSRL